MATVYTPDHPQVRALAQVLAGLTADPSALLDARVQATVDTMVGAVELPESTDSLPVAADINSRGVADQVAFLLNAGVTSDDIRHTAQNEVQPGWGDADAAQARLEGSLDGSAPVARTRF